MEKYMIGDVFGNLWNEDTGELFTNRGTIFNCKETAERKLVELSERKQYYDWQLKLWTMSIK